MKRDGENVIIYKTYESLTPKTKMAKEWKAVLILLAVLFFLLVYFFWVRKDMTDFSVCYQGGKG